MGAIYQKRNCGLGEENWDSTTFNFEQVLLIFLQNDLQHHRRWETLEIRISGWEDWLRKKCHFWVEDWDWKYRVMKIVYGGFALAFRRK